MIVFNLACSQGHPFEGWFASADEFQKQQQYGLVACPICNDSHVEKGLSAPRLNLGHVVPPKKAGAENKAGTEMANVEAQQQAYMGTQEMVLRQFKRYIMANTENVGGEFAETARRMHYGEEGHRNIRGQVSSSEARELHDEGIETMALPQGVMLDDGLQ